MIISHATSFYLDHPNEPDPEDPGLYWAARFIPDRKTFGYMPESVYDNIDFDMMGNPLDEDDVCGGIIGPGCVPLDEGKEGNVIG